MGLLMIHNWDKLFFVALTTLRLSACPHRRATGRLKGRLIMPKDLSCLRIFQTLLQDLLICTYSTINLNLKVSRYGSYRKKC